MDVRAPLQTQQMRMCGWAYACVAESRRVTSRSLAAHRESDPDTFVVPDAFVVSNPLRVDFVLRPATQDPG